MAILQVIFAHNVTDYRENKRESPNPHALQCDLVHLSRLFTNAIIGLLSICIFPEKQGM